MFGIGMPELIVIFLILLLVFGARKLPEIGSGIGKGIRNFRGSLKDTQKEIDSAGEKSEHKKDDDES